MYIYIYVYIYVNKIRLDNIIIRWIKTWFLCKTNLIIIICIIPSDFVYFLLVTNISNIYIYT